ncbi:TIGR04104 family putative zinc finger protein [Bacillus sp. AK128]
MNNHICTNCGNRFKWTSIFKNIWQAYKPLICQECEVKHRVTHGSQAFVSLLIILPMLLFGEVFAGLSLIPKLMIMLTIGFIISLFVPFMVKYKLEPQKKEARVLNK